MPLPYHDGCPACEAARAYWKRIDDGVQAVAQHATGDVVVGVTINAEDVPQCPDHLSFDD